MLKIINRVKLTNTLYFATRKKNIYTQEITRIKTIFKEVMV